MLWLHLLSPLPLPPMLASLPIPYIPLPLIVLVLIWVIFSWEKTDTTYLCLAFSIHMMLSFSIHFPLWVCKYPLYTDISHFFYSSVDRLQGWFYSLATMNTALIAMPVQMSLVYTEYLSHGCTPRDWYRWITQQFWLFWWLTILFSLVGVLTYCAIWSWWSIWLNWEMPRTSGTCLTYLHRLSQSWASLTLIFQLSKHT